MFSDHLIGACQPEESFDFPRPKHTMLDKYHRWFCICLVQVHWLWNQCVQPYVLSASITNVMIIKTFQHGLSTYNSLNFKPPSIILGLPVGYVNDPTRIDRKVVSDFLFFFQILTDDLLMR